MLNVHFQNYNIHGKTFKTVNLSNSLVSGDKILFCWIYYKAIKEFLDKNFENY